MYNELSYRIKNYSEVNAKKYTLLDRGDDAWYYSTHHHSYISQTYVGNSKQNELKSALDSLVNLSWLTIHRVSSSSRKEEKSFESTIDQKIGELQIDLVKYFSVLNRKYTVETERFQKYIFESMIDVVNDATILPSKDINPEKEKSSLKQIFYHFQLPERAINQKLDNYFNSFEKAVLRIKESKELTISDLAYTIGIRRIHAVVQEWNKVIDKQKEINKSKETFLSLINSLLQRKSLFINERNELTVRTQSGKIFPLTNLSSGEKQLLIILGQSLLQEENIHVYIADEPELSLHIEWQEKLVKSLKSLNPNSQIIFATHSPDIVGEFGKYVIKVEEAIR
jgi:predicted ATP-binding protein involved in virulence